MIKIQQIIAHNWRIIRKKIDCAAVGIFTLFPANESFTASYCILPFWCLRNLFSLHITQGASVILIFAEIRPYTLHTTPLPQRLSALLQSAKQGPERHLRHRSGPCFFVFCGNFRCGFPACRLFSGSQILRACFRPNRRCRNIVPTPDHPSQAYPEGNTCGNFQIFSKEIRVQPTGHLR